MNRKVVRFGRLGGIVVATAFLAFGHETAGSAESTEPVADDGRTTPLQIICPAIEVDDWRRDDSDEPRGPVAAVVRATASVSRAYPRYAVVELSIDKVLYSSVTIPARVLRATTTGGLPLGRPMIVAMMYEDDYPEQTPYYVKYAIDPSEETSQTALAAARFDYHVLSAVSVFVGKESKGGIGDKKQCAGEVEVVRVLYGDQVRAGQKLAFEEAPIIADTVRPKTAIYLLEYAGPNWQQRTIYTLKDCFGVDREAAVVAALRRRDEYPAVVVRRRDYYDLGVWSEGNELRCREIGFHGSIAEALALMRSARAGAALLGTRALRQAGDRVRPAVVAAAEQDLLRHPPLAREKFAPLRRSIDLLIDLGQARPEGDLGALVGKYLDYVASSPPEPPPMGTINAFHDRPRFNANHALTWMLCPMDHRDVVCTYGRRLAQLRDRALGRWKDELQMAMDACRVDADFEISAALGRTPPLPSMRSPTSPLRSLSERPDPDRKRIPSKRDPDPPGLYGIAFSADGRLLAGTSSEGIQLWRTTDWSLVRRIPMELSAVRGDHGESPSNEVVLSPDAQLVYVFGPGGLVCVACDTGETVWSTDRLALQGRPRITPDGRTLVAPTAIGAARRRALAHRADPQLAVQVWHAPTGEVLASHPVPADFRGFDVAPASGRLLIVSDRGWTMRSLRDGNAKPVDFVAAEKVHSAIFTADEKFLATAEGREAPEYSGQNDDVSLYLRRAEEGFAVATSVKIGCAPAAVQIAPDGSCLAAVCCRRGNGVFVYRLPELKLMTQLNPAGLDRYFPYGVVFSPDSRAMVVTCGGIAFWCYALPEIALKREGYLPENDPPLPPELSAAVARWAFSSDGKRLAVASSGRPTPRLFAAPEWQEFAPYRGHGDTITGLRWASDGKRLRTVGRDEAIRTWDAATLEVIDGLTMPPLWRIFEVSEPAGRYAFCTPGSFLVPARGRAAVCDVELKKMLPLTSLRGWHFDRDLPKSPGRSKVVWLSHDELVCVVEQRRARVNFRTDKVLDTVARNEYLPDSGHLGTSQLSEDRRFLWILGHDHDKNPSILFRVARRLDWLTMNDTGIRHGIDFEALHRARIDRLPSPDTERGTPLNDVSEGPSGLVPDGRHFYIGPEIYDRETFRKVGGHAMRGFDVSAIAFTPDGRRFAAAVHPDFAPAAAERPYDRRKQDIIRVQETLSGRTLFAFPASTPDIQHMRFAPDGRRLAVVNTDDTLEIWDVPTELNSR